MNELYWITRLDYFHSVSSFFLILGAIIVFLFSLFYYVSNGQSIYDDSRGHSGSAKEYKEYRDTCSKGLKWSIPVTLLALFLYLFIPTTNEALLIYGVGGTVDYLQSNPTAKKLPDKCIQALDRWVDSWSIEEKDSVE